MSHLQEELTLRIIIGDWEGVRNVLALAYVAAVPAPKLEMQELFLRRLIGEIV